jgi:hypothetical protein
MDITITAAIRDRRLLGGVFKDVKTWRAWMVFLSALFNLPIEDPEDLKIFQECTGLIEPPKERIREAAVICGRRSGKSFISAIIAVFLACFRDWTPYLTAGERAWIFIIATDRMQSSIIQGYIRGIMNSSDVLRSMIDQELKEELHLKNGVSIGIKTSSWRGVRGFNLAAAIAEETAFWRSEETSANPDVEILRAVRPSLATIPESILLSVSTPYSRRGTLFQTFKKNYGQAGPVLVWKAESLRMNPTLDPEIIKAALRDDFQSASSEWLSSWRSDIEGFLSLELVENCTISGRRDLPRIDGIQYRAFTDPSSGRVDSFVLTIGHAAGDGTVIVDILREKRSPFDPVPVVEDYATLLKNWGIAEVVSDKYAIGFVVDLFKRQGIKVTPAPLTASEYFLEFLPMLTSSSVELPDDRHLAAQLTNLERRTRSGGKDLVCHPPGLHDDVANAIAGLCVMIRSKPKRKGFVTYVGSGRVSSGGSGSICEMRTKTLQEIADEPTAPVSEEERRRIFLASKGIMLKPTKIQRGFNWKDEAKGEPKPGEISPTSAAAGQTEAAAVKPARPFKRRVFFPAGRRQSISPDELKGAFDRLTRRGDDKP